MKFAPPFARYDLDYEYGRQGEIWFAELLKDSETGKIEVKRDRRFSQTGNVFVEYKLEVRPDQWEWSGLPATEADVWVFKLRERGIVIRSDELRPLAEYCLDQRERVLQLVDDGTYRAQGVAVPAILLILAIQTQGMSNQEKLVYYRSTQYRLKESMVFVDHQISEILSKAQKTSTQEDKNDEHTLD